MMTSNTINPKTFLYRPPYMLIDDLSIDRLPPKQAVLMVLESECGFKGKTGHCRLVLSEIAKRAKVNLKQTERIIDNLVQDGHLVYNREKSLSFTEKYYGMPDVDEFGNIK